MYRVNPYFVEIQPERLDGDRWTAVAQFSRKMDYVKPGTVYKCRFSTQVEAATKSDAESAAVRWARLVVAHAPHLIESSFTGVRQDRIPTA